MKKALFNNFKVLGFYFRDKIFSFLKPQNKNINHFEIRGRLLRYVSLFLSITIIGELNLPIVAYALTSGPSQPEMQSFEPVNTTQMVDLFSGDFVYNIPLLDVGGYPINISYHSGITMDQEASWVGLGWNINPGEINRQMRGLPDDFSGDTVKKDFNVKPDITYGATVGGGIETAGLPIGVGLNLSLGIFNNSYKGIGVTLGLDPSVTVNMTNKTDKTEDLGLKTSLGLNFNSQTGLDISPSIGLGPGVQQEKYSLKGSLTKKTKADVTSLTFKYYPSISADINSRSGFKGFGENLNILRKEHDNTGAIVRESSQSIGSQISFASSTYLPSLSLPYKNESFSLQGSVGGELFIVYGNAFLSGFYSKQSLQYHNEKVNAYGYLHSENSTNNPKALLDFNREKDIAFKKSSVNLPITNYTYDLYSVNGQGIGGQFRPFRGDVGILHEPYLFNESSGFSGGVEIGLGDIVHVGGNVSFPYTLSTQGEWLEDNDFRSTVKFKGLDHSTLYEPFFFKNVGEKTVNDQDYYASIGNDKAVQVQLWHPNFTASYRAMSSFRQKVGAQSYADLPVVNNIVRNHREKRHQVMSFLTSAEAHYHGLENNILSFHINSLLFDNCSNSDIDTINRLSHPYHHISEVTVLNPDGKRYVYGIPAYNNTQKEVVFSVDHTKGNIKTSLAKYSGNDATIHNQQGTENYFNSMTLPAYSHSYLLTDVLSPDYVDLTGNGISDDDLGEAVKLNYSRALTDYNWRTPYEKDSANYQEGFLSDPKDDKGNYVWGTKEIWYAHSIESKNFIAVFLLSNRQDGFGVLNESGGIDSTKHLKKLDEIRLYSKEDLLKNGSKATPVKTVHLVYDYQLCNKILNGNINAGKLTLKEIYFTYGNNTQGRLNSYQFQYNSYNPNYNHNKYDRWGNYKSNGSFANSLDESDYPYTIQNTDSTSKWSSSWTLTDILLPSGGKISVQYEADDYAYIQNIRAMQMFFIAGFSNNPNNTGLDSVLFSGNNYKNYMYIDVPDSVLTDKEVYQKYLDGISDLYFKCKVDVDNTNSDEFITGYAQIDSFKRVNNNRIWIKLKSVDAEGVNHKTSPISLASWQFVRLNLPQRAYPGSQNSGDGAGLISALVGIASEIQNVIFGFNGNAENNKWGQQVILNQSCVRLDNPSYKKLGGGCRVKQISSYDNWNSMTGGQEASYGQRFDYTITKEINGVAETISSGVASYEPLIGGDEIALRTPLNYEEKVKLAPNNDFYSEKPLGESLYPAPIVGYSKVTVSSINDAIIKRTATGKSVTEFYTAYDYPVINEYTDLIPGRVKPNPIFKLFQLGSKDYMTATQGFLVECNDMHGKVKDEITYDAQGGELARTDYHYRTVNDSAIAKKLNNDNVPILNTDGSVDHVTIGKDIDLTEDMRQHWSESHAMSIPLNVESFFAFIVLIIPTVFQAFGGEKLQFRSSVTTKYAYQYGILDRVTKTENGSSVTTENMLFDGETGEPLLTKTTNEFSDTLYSLTYPAHWAYSGMAGAYQNIMANIQVGHISDGRFTELANPEDYFTPGDELSLSLVKKSNTKYWIAKPKDKLVIIDNTGKPYNNPNEPVFRVIRSGHRNMPGIPIATLVSLKNPIVSNQLQIDTSLHIIQSSAIEYNDEWKTKCDKVRVRDCNFVAGPSQCCLKKLLVGLCNHPNYFLTTPSDSMYVSDILPDTTCSSHFSGGQSASTIPFYMIGTVYGYNMTTTYQAQVGNCTLIISSIDGQPFSLDSLNIQSLYDCTTTSDPIPLVKPSRVGEVLVANASISCLSCSTSCVDLAVGDTINPYAYGILGNWRPWRDYVYYDKRTPSHNTQTDIERDGYYTSFSSLWNYDTVTKNLKPSFTNSKWVKKNEITLYNEKGAEVETKDASNRYGAALYGYLQSLPTAVASNSKYREVAFDNFEDYLFANSCDNPCFEGHFSFKAADDASANIKVDSTVSHSGRKSLKLQPNITATASKSITYYSDSLLKNDSTSFVLKHGGCLYKFNPDSGDYLIGAWVKENNSCTTGNYISDSIKITFDGSTQKYEFSPSGLVIEGWQRYEAKFHVPSTATAIYVSLISKAYITWFDDVRIHPYHGNMKSFVYDPYNLRLAATLDENNYAMFYEYDDEGNLVRLKKETEKGIVTIQESRSQYTQ